ncbi:Salicylate hydroxylase [Sulfitobacter noctilucicola]|uniref:Salicylate hydroxylase n=1 Tax=Sulfitobacter noctilucicola TaxID=1342301 RepID=A0A7W6MBL7_9RHOB|nr:FAD-dependent monooxygenase [Sulfitobacter noctilucicola]KIN66437.1 Salicylate hydroxylase [Sulfitobacter noctilucicola]MBB4175782.1 salicylate hydroxylase [Sulfitobacter noctilucicola]
MTISNAIVVGGGIGGLAAAAALAQRGVAVTVLEQAPALGEVGAGLQVSPNGLAVLRNLGVVPALRSKQAVAAQAVVLRDYAAGATVAVLDLKRHRPDQSYLFVHRADLVDALAGAAKRANVTFEMGAQVASVRPGPTPQVQLADGSTRRAELIVAADGIHSVARAVLNGPDKAAFSGQVAWRAVIENSMQHPAQAHVHMGPGRHLVSYPLRGGSLVNLVAVEERDDWAQEGWNLADDPAHLKAAFSGFGGPAARMIAAVEDVTLWGLHLHPVATRWHDQGIALLGDAAHPTLPFLAQGANLALEDAWVLADAVTRNGAGGLEGYQSSRLARVPRVIRAAQGNAKRYHLRPGPVRSAAHLGLRLASRLAPGRMIGAFDWLYGHDVTDKVHRKP